MRARPFSRFFFGALLLLAGLASASGGCSRQTEGERCDDENGDTEDCDSGLVCTSCDRLRTLDVDRCCPPEGSPYSDPRCAPTNPGGTCSTQPDLGEGGEGASPDGNRGGSGGTSGPGSGGVPGDGGVPGSSSGGVPGDGGVPGSNGGSPGGGGDTAAGSGGSDAVSGAGGESGAVNASGTGGA